MLNKYRITSLIVTLFAIIKFNANPNLDSLWKVWNNNSLPDTNRLKALDDIIWFNYLRTNPDSAIYWAKQEYTFSEKVNQPAYMSLSLNAQAAAYSGMGNSAAAKQSLLNRLVIDKQQNDLVGQASVYSNLGSIYKSEGDVTNALKYNFAGLKMFELLDNKAKVALLLENIGTIYLDKKDFTNGLKYLHKSLKIKLALGKSAKLGITYLNLAIAYKSMKKFSVAEVYFNKAEKIFLEENNLVQLSILYYNLGDLMLLKKQNDETIKFANKILELNKTVKYPMHEALSFKLLSKAYEQKNNSDKAVFYAKAAIEIAVKENFLELKSTIGATLRNEFEKRRDFEQALKYYEISEKAKLILNEEAAKRSASVEQLKYDFWKKELLLNTENEKKTALLRNQISVERLKKSRTLYVSVSILVILILCVIFVYGYFKQKQIIQYQKNNILKQKFLVSQMNPHFIFNSLNAIQNYILKNNPLEACEFLSKFSKLIRMTLDNSRKDFISVANERELVLDYIELQKLRFSNKFNYSLFIDESIDLETTKIPPMLAQPFIENAIEHGLFHKTLSGNVDIRILSINGSLIYEIEDDGVGIEMAAKLKRDIGTKYESLATSISKERIRFLGQKLKGKYEIEIIDKKKINDLHTGVKIKFAIPFIKN